MSTVNNPNAPKGIQTEDQTQVQPQEKITQKLPNRRPMKAKQPGEKSAGAFRTISEVAGELNVEQHVLRFWETKFNQIKPLKRGGGRRYYRPEDIELLKNIHHLLYNEGYTIKGVQKLLTATRGNLTPRVQDGPEVLAAEPEAVSPVTRAVEQNRDELEQMLAELKSMRKLID
jgi:DNA-binding transcriptional MerR regulator